MTISGYGISITITPEEINTLTVDGFNNIVTLFKKAASDIVTVLTPEQSEPNPPVFGTLQKSEVES